MIDSPSIPSYLLLQRPPKIVTKVNYSVSPLRHVNLNALCINSIDHGSSLAVTPKPNRDLVIELNILTGASRDLRGADVDWSLVEAHSSVDDGRGSIGLVLEAKTALRSTVIDIACKIWVQRVGLTGPDGAEISRRLNIG